MPLGAPGPGAMLLGENDLIAEKGPLEKAVVGGGSSLRTEGSPDLPQHVGTEHGLWATLLGPAGHVTWGN